MLIIECVAIWFLGAVIVCTLNYWYFSDKRVLRKREGRY
jgi:hypothetical protein